MLKVSIVIRFHIESKKQNFNYLTTIGLLINVILITLAHLIYIVQYKLNKLNAMLVFIL